MSNTAIYKPNFQKEERKMNLAMTGELALGSGAQSGFNGMSTHDSNFNSQGYKSNEGFGLNMNKSPISSSNEMDQNDAQNSLRLLKSKQNNDQKPSTGSSSNSGYTPSILKPNFSLKQTGDENSFNVGAQTSNSINSKNVAYESDKPVSSLPPRVRNGVETSDSSSNVAPTKPPIGQNFNFNNPKNNNNNSNTNSSNNAPQSQPSSMPSKPNNQNVGSRNSSLKKNKEKDEEEIGNYMPSSVTKSGSLNQLQANDHEKKHAIATGVEDLPVEPYAKDDVELIECPEGCGRQFVDEALEKHIKICKKVFQTKRKEFNSQAHRMVSQQQVKIVRQQNTKAKIEEKQVKPKDNKQPQWQAQSEAFRNVVQQATGTEGQAPTSKLEEVQIVTQKPPPAPANNAQQGKN